MKLDPIVEETRKLREQYAARFDNNPDAIFEDIKRRQAEGGRELVKLPPRKPRHRTAPA